jgi:hypothetical protein
MATKTGFKITSDPMKAKDTSREIVNPQTTKDGGEGNSIVNRGVLRDNPQHHYASELEDKQGSSGQYQPGKQTLCAPGPSRIVTNHAFSREAGYHAHMGTAGRAHSFPGRRK